MKQLLLIGDPNSLYVHNYASKLRSHFGNSLQIDLFVTFSPKKKREELPYDHLFGCFGGKTRHSQMVQRISRPIRLFMFLLRQKGKYDAVHVLYCIQDLILAGKILRNASPCLILTVFGSDFFLLPEWRKRLMRPVFQSADFVTSNNTVAAKAIRESLSLDSERLKLCRFGFDALDTLYQLRDLPQSESRRRLHLPTGKLIICIGYNYDPIQQHLPVLKSIAANQLLLKRKEELFFLIPMTYGTEPGYKTELLQALSQFPFQYMTLEDFLPDEELAHLRKSPDIMIQLQKSDSFSASTQEHMFAGNLLITGSWLPYRDLSDSGVYFRSVQKVEDIGSELSLCIANLKEEKEKCRPNPDHIYKLSSWNANLPSWLRLYQ